MEASDHDERLRRLQRIAYGADAAPDADGTAGLNASEEPAGG